MGGDEFCVLARIDDGRPDMILEIAGAALTEHGTAFTISASYGSVLLPTETHDVSEALRLADQRMYARKSLGSRSSAGRQSTDVLLKVLSERIPTSGPLTRSRTCAADGNPPRRSRGGANPSPQAAALHDVGKSAVPDAILEKPGPLTDDEMMFIRRHTLIGERILGVAPSLSKPAKLVRWSHERYDGGGYPDGIGGEEIPIGSRIISVCDAYHAMVSNRAYRPARSPQEAVAELRAAPERSSTRPWSGVLAALAEVPATAGTLAGAVPV